MKLVRVALPVPLYNTFDYGISAHTLPKLGTRVRVPFAKKQLVGVVVAHPKTAQVAAKRLKFVLDVLDKEPVIDSQLMSLARFLSDYYHYPLGETLSALLPAQLRQGKAWYTTQAHWRLSDTHSPAQVSKRAHVQRAAYELIAQYTTGVPQHALLAQGIKKATLAALQKKGVITSYHAAPKKAPHQLKQPPLSLNAEQKSAFDAVVKHLGGYAGFLLAGITGSGKTEVYLQLIDAVLHTGKQVLLLVPEIGLTPQTLGRLTDRFAAKIVSLHSHMNETERLSAWLALRSGEAHIAIGTRLSVFAPFADLGLIIVDEEHDTSFKQHNHLRYHARDVAMYRAKAQSCPVLLGSATPSFESLRRVQLGKLTQLNLLNRAGGAQAPIFKVLDVRGQRLHNGLGEKALNAIAYTLDNNAQALVFLNRRGYAPVLVCGACGWQADCPRCDARLTLHYTPYHQLRCHHCGWQQAKPRTCQDCGSDNLEPVGVGTARLEESLAAHFKNYKLLRVDADTTRKKHAWQDIYQHIKQHKNCILLGTQMLAKGHHFADVTLVVLPNIDQGLLSSDFRAPERIAQLTMQVAGRAGRAKKQGTVLMQTLRPDNSLLKTLITKGYLAFAKDGLKERKLLGLPPYTHAALVRASSKTAERTRQALEVVKEVLHGGGVAIWGPVAAPMEKQANRYHGHLLILCSNRNMLQQQLAMRWTAALEQQALKSVQISLDVDPVEF